MSERIDGLYKDGMVEGIHQSGRDTVIRARYDNGKPNGHTVDFIVRAALQQQPNIQPVAEETPHE